MRALDERTLEIRAHAAGALLPGPGRAYVEFIPVKQELIEAARAGDGGSTRPTGSATDPSSLTGIERDASPPRITLVRNERYWGGQAEAGCASSIER